MQGVFACRSFGQSIKDFLAKNLWDALEEPSVSVGSKMGK